MATKFKNVHYRVHALQDGTIWFVTTTRKPRRSRASAEPDIDEDGVYSWYLEKPGDEEVNECSDWGKGVWHTCVAMTLNVKRIIRQQVEGRLDILQEQLNRIEGKMDRLLGVTHDR